MNRCLAALAVLVILFAGFAPPITARAQEGNPACQDVALIRTDVTLENGAAVCVSKAQTCLFSVDAELNALVDGFLALYKPGLEALAPVEGARARLDVGVYYSRTGTSWLSFMVYARVSRGGAIETTDFITRSYDMLTGARVTLTTLFQEDSEVWGILEAGVRKAFLRYYPDQAVNTRVVDQMLRSDSLQQADFTLHGASLVLHYRASLLFEGKSAILQVPFYYPELRGHMRDEAYAQTNNSLYYKMVCLTYSDGPSQTSTPRLLNALADNGVRASFFVCGSRIAGAAALVQRERDEGHAIGGQNWLNTDTSAWPPEAVRAIRARVDDALTQATGFPSAYTRAPFGIYEPLLEAKTGWAVIQWSVDPNDLAEIAPEEIAARVRAQVQDGDIILLHDTTLRCEKNTQRIIDALKADGYLFLTVDEMFAKDRVPLLGNLVYYRCAGGDFSPK